MDRYPEYKVATIEWLDEIPHHWNVRRLRSTIIDCINGVWGDPPEGNEHDVICVRVADFLRDSYRVDISDPTTRSIDPKQVDSRRLHKGDLLLEKSGGGEKQSVGAVMLYDHNEKAICSNFIARMRIRENNDSNYLTYLHAALYNLGVNKRSIKQTTGIQNLDQYSYLSEDVPLPPINEQEIIAEYLDRESDRIDRLIGKQERLIELLEEKRTALISHTVTKGLDPDVEMKDSGLEWMGKIPKHWEIQRLKSTIIECVNGVWGDNPKGNDNDIICVRVADFIRDKLRVDIEQPTFRSIDKKKIESRKLRSGDLLLEKSGGGENQLVGAVMLYDHDEDAVCSNFIARMRIKRGFDPEFITYLHHVLYEWKINYRSIKQTTGIQNLDQHSYLSESVPVPPYDEQIKISNYINNETGKTGKLRYKINKSITKLKEYRNALISAAVTGKIDVRDQV